MWTDKAREKSVEKKKEQALERYQNGKYKHLANGALKKILLTSGREYKCEDCGLDEWQGVKLSLHLEHVEAVGSNKNIADSKWCNS